MGNYLLISGTDHFVQALKFDLSGNKNVSNPFPQQFAKRHHKTAQQKPQQHVKRADLAHNIPILFRIIPDIHMKYLIYDTSCQELQTGQQHAPGSSPAQKALPF